MKLSKIYLRDNAAFSKHIREWAESMNMVVDSYEFNPNEDQAPDGLLLINENQDIRRDIDEIHTFFDKKHIPTQKIDVNGTLKVAVNSFRIWVESNKCRGVLIVGVDELVNNENLDRFLSLFGQLL